jgi:hypothetical protein
MCHRLRLRHWVGAGQHAQSGNIHLQNDFLTISQLSRLLRWENSSDIFLAA